MERHIRLIVEYDGSGLCGWQRQDNGPTVQGHLEEALAQLFGQPIAVVGASRTDAGVHARGQVASFRAPKPIALHGIRRGLNSLLPPVIAIRDAAEVSADFHPRFSATGKRYRYTILSRADRSPRWRERAWHIAVPLDRRSMIEAATTLIGEHDFAAFRAAGCAAHTTIRRLDRIELSEHEQGEVVTLDVVGNAFLRNMVRIIVGTLVEVARGAFTVTQVAEILASKDRGVAGPTAPAHGLELIEVHYDGTRPNRV